MITILLAFLGLSFLVFIHELGHFIMARKVGMRVESFAIGFGKAIFSRTINGVQWRLNILPFGGYVKIAGMQQEKGQDPYEIKDGYFGKKPLDRIKVSLMGPIANIVFAFFAFSLIWISGGREKSFHELNNRIGYVDTSSNLYKMGVRPGDQVLQYANKDFHRFQDIILPSLSKSLTTSILVNKLEHFSEEKEKRFYNLYNYQQPNTPFKTIGFLAPASYLILESMKDSSLLAKNGMKRNDRIIWANGELIFSAFQLREVVNKATTFITFMREGKIQHTKVPYFPLKDYRLSSAEKAELDDWMHESGMKKEFKEVSFIPYVVSSDSVVQYPLTLIDPLLDEKSHATNTRSYQTPLQHNDKIIAINGTPIHSGYELLQNMQNKSSLFIVRSEEPSQPISWKKAEQSFISSINLDNLSFMINQIGTKNMIEERENLRLLNPVISLSEKSEINKESSFYLFSGANFIDKKVLYNPDPLQLFGSVLYDIWQTLSGLFTGALHPKYVSGPVGIVQVVSTSWAFGIKEALYWLGFISLNLGIVNLLPIPMLDGGHIVFSGVEMATRRKIKPKTMEKIIYPFLVLLIVFFLYVTYQDVLRVWFS